MRNLSKILAMAALAGAMGTGTMALTAAPAAAQMVRDRVVVGHPGFRNRVVVRDGRFHRPFVRDRFRIGVGFVGGYPYYPYDYGYGYPYGYSYNAYCDPNSVYYDPDDCGY